LCNEHYSDEKEGIIDKCKECGNYKLKEYKVCVVCKFKKGSSHKKEKQVTLDKHFVYMLKLNNGKYYIGESSDIRSRLVEHRDGETISTQGLEPKLKYFEVLDSKEGGKKREKELKDLYKKNPRIIRRMCIEFEDLINVYDLD